MAQNFDALREAVEEGVEQLAEVLAAHHDSTEEQLSDVLGTATYSGYADSARLLLRHGAIITDRAILGVGDVETWAVLLEHGLDPNREVTTTIYFGRRVRLPVLSLLPSPQTLDCLMLLLACGADINAFDSNGLSALDRAVKYSSLDPAKLLLDCGAKLQPPVLFHALGRRLKNRPAMVRFLLQAGADPSPAPIDNFSTVLHKAIDTSWDDDEMEGVVVALMDAGADPGLDVESLGRQGLTAFELAKALDWHVCPAVVEAMRARLKTDQA